MKKIKFYIHSLYVISLIAVGFAVASCTNELWDGEDDVQVLKMKLNIGLQQFDGVGSRAASSFPDGASLLMRFDSEAYGTAVYDKTADNWNVSLKGSLKNTSSGSCDLYYSPNKKPSSTYTLSLDHSTPLYSAKGVYSYSESGPVITATLKPAVPRVCFKGTSGKKISLSGLSYYKSVDVTKSNALSTGSSDISLTVNGTSTDYIYGFFAGSNRDLTLTVDGVSYTRTIESSMFTNGQSGYIDIPTASNLGKWKETTIQSITLNKSSVEMTEGETLQLSATISPSTAVNKTLKWTSSSSCVTVSSTGLLTAKTAGKATITATATDGSGKKATCDVTVKSAAILVSKIELSQTTADLLNGESLSLTATVTPSNATNKTLEWSSDQVNASVSSTGRVTSNYNLQKTVIITAKAKDGSGVSASCTVNIIPKYNDHGYVDLGLPSGTKWATTNLGAYSPEKIGNYYAWGNLTTSTIYDNAHLKYWDSYKYTKYTTSYKDAVSGSADYKKTLDSSDDVARFMWEGIWRMPTKTECEELIRYCTWSEETLNGVKGFRVKGKNAFSIFLPNTGYKSDSALDVSTAAYYWSSSLYETSKPYALKAFGISNIKVDTSIRCWGMPVRPVRQ